MTRREEREQALCFLYEAAFQTDEPPETIMENAALARSLEIGPYARKIFTGVTSSLPEIDVLIEPNLIGWKKSRISKLTMSILRLAAFELTKVKSVPTKVAINEAVELAKKFASPEDAAYINGILGSVARKL